jgi:hypothetical protein
MYLVLLHKIAHRKRVYLPATHPCSRTSLSVALIRRRGKRDLKRPTKGQTSLSVALIRRRSLSHSHTKYLVERGIDSAPLLTLDHAVLSESHLDIPRRCLPSHLTNIPKKCIKNKTKSQCPSPGPGQRPLRVQLRFFFFEKTTCCARRLLRWRKASASRARRERYTGHNSQKSAFENVYYVILCNM